MIDKKEEKYEAGNAEVQVENEQKSDTCKKKPETEKQKFSRKKALLSVVLAIGIIICIRILIVYSVYILKWINDIRTGISISQSEGLIDLISLAVTVWIGLSIYNTISEKDLEAQNKKLHELREQTEKEINDLRDALLNETSQKRILQNIIQNMQEAFSEGEGYYLSMKLKGNMPVPSDVLQKIDEIQYYYSEQGEKYKGSVRILQNRERGDRFEYTGAGKDIRVTDETIKLMESMKEQLNHDQLCFLTGLLSLYKGFFLYNYVQFHSRKNPIDDRKEFIENTLSSFQTALEKLFGIDNGKIVNGINLSREKRNLLAKIYNAMGSVSIAAFREEEWQQLRIEDRGQLGNDSVTYLEGAEKNFQNVSQTTKEVYLRNLGAAYKRVERFGDALKAYKAAYEQNGNSPKIFYVCGSLYRDIIAATYKQYIDINWAKNKFVFCHYKIKKMDEYKKEELKRYLERGIYWYGKRFQTNETQGTAPWIDSMFDVLEAIDDEKDVKLLKKLFEKEREFRESF